MRPQRLGEIAKTIGGRVQGHDALVTSVCIDSRAGRPGALFCALRGERHDGHAFVREALAAGAAAALVADTAELPAGTGPLLRAASTGAALLDLAAAERRALGARVVGVTGANGKTSTKDLAAGVLATRFRTHANRASLNTEIGVPLTVLEAPEATEVLVLELGARHLGDVAKLCELFRPDLAVVTNVGVAHMEIFGSWSAIVEASAEPVSALSRDGVAILGIDDPTVRGYAGRARGRALTFGRTGDADVRAEEVRLDPRGWPSFTLVHGDAREPVALGVAGEHMVQNALAAASIGISLELTVAECAAGLKDAHVSDWRMQTFEAPGGVTVVNDAYNANPESMAAGLRSARWIARERRLVAVLGHMAELGSVGPEEHERVGELVARLGVGLLITVGEPADAIAGAAVREGLDPVDVASVPDADAAARQLGSDLRAGDVVFLKGSRVVGLELVAEGLRGSGR